MKVLLDTNIVIHRETIDPKNKDIGKLFWWIDKLRYEKCIHQVTLNEIFKNKNVKARRAFKVKLESYYQLQTQAPMDPQVKLISQKIDTTSNDFNDTILLNEVYTNRVSSLITEDRKIHKKAEALGIFNQVFTIESFLEKVIKENPELKEYKIPSIIQERFGNVAIDDEFFDSLKKDYVGFEDWFNTKSEEKAYISSPDGKISAFLYLKKEEKTEDYSNISPRFVKKNRLKIGTLKVQLTGYKIGERFIKIIFDNALNMSVDEIYVTLFEKRRPDTIYLVNLLKDFGFKYHGVKTSDSGKESVYVRDFSPNASLINPKKTYPFMSKKVTKFIVPIYPEYHTNLFLDSILRTESPDEFIEHETYRNAVSKVYVSRSRVRNLKTGDIIIFYRTATKGKPGKYTSVISTIGVVEKIHNSIETVNQFVKLCGQRSVFSENELRKYWNEKKTFPFIVKFLYAYSFPKRLNLEKLIELNVIQNVYSVPRGFQRLSEQSFKRIIKETKTNGTIIVN